jgi:hypothetical protein
MPLSVLCLKLACCSPLFEEMHDPLNVRVQEQRDDYDHHRGSDFPEPVKPNELVSQELGENLG